MQDFGPFQHLAVRGNNPPTYQFNPTPTSTPQQRNPQATRQDGSFTSQAEAASCAVPISRQEPAGCGLIGIGRPPVRQTRQDRTRQVDLPKRAYRSVEKSDPIARSRMRRAAIPVCGLVHVYMYVFYSLQHICCQMQCVRACMHADGKSLPSSPNPRSWGGGFSSIDKDILALMNWRVRLSVRWQLRPLGSVCMILRWANVV
jgi:hypothetical protein